MVQNEDLKITKETRVFTQCRSKFERVPHKASFRVKTVHRERNSISCTYICMCIVCCFFLDELFDRLNYFRRPAVTKRCHTN